MPLFTGCKNVKNVSGWVFTIRLVVYTLWTHISVQTPGKSEFCIIGPL